MKLYVNRVQNKSAGHLKKHNHESIHLYDDVICSGITDSLNSLLHLNRAPTFSVVSHII